MCIEKQSGTWPTQQDYDRRASIPAIDRCTTCKGLGLVRYKFSSAANSEHDYQTCRRCHGSGRVQEVQAAFSQTGQGGRMKYGPEIDLDF